MDIHCSFDVRFKGQTSEIRIALDDGEQIDGNSVRKICEAFEEEHEKVYGHRSEADNPVEVVAVRIVARARNSGQVSSIRPAECHSQKNSHRQAYFDGERIETPVLARGTLRDGCDGPLLIDEYDSTIVVPPGARAWLDEHANVVIEPSS